MAEKGYGKEEGGGGKIPENFWIYHDFDDEKLKLAEQVRIE